MFTERLIGMFVNMLPIRTTMHGDLSFRQLLRQARDTTLEAFTNQDLPFDVLIKELGIKWDPSRSPLFQTVFVLQNMPQAPDFENITVTLPKLDNATAKYDLMLQLFPDVGGSLTGFFEYNTDLFERETIRRLAGHYEVLLRGLVADPKRSIGQLPILTERETFEQFHTWNNTEPVDRKEACIHELFEAQAILKPDAVAVVWEDQCLTYRELNERANQLAHWLNERDLEKEKLVGICVERTPTMLIAMIGVLKAGYAYLPLDPHLPKDRLAYMLTDSEVAVIISSPDLLHTLPREPEVGLLVLGRSEETLACYPTHNTSVNIDPGDLAYVVYTSGSTGLPKGVMIEHRSVCAFVSWVLEFFSEAERSVVLASTSLSFDVSVLELYGTLAGGGRVILVDNVLEIAKQAQVDGITLLSTVPSALQELLSLKAIPDSVKVICSAGEP
ncbi:MAG: AMP-binding protein, partial [Saprospiraceae bacterium]|nr:AMP-binding protein [Saprospiraceae bacterium]